MTSLSYQTSVTIIEAEFSGYVPVCMFLNDAHIRELDRATEMVKLHLQARSFLGENGGRREGGGRLLKVFTVITERC